MSRPTLCMGASKQTPTTLLLKEIGWESLSDKHMRKKLLLTAFGHALLMLLSLANAAWSYETAAPGNNQSIINHLSRSCHCWQMASTTWLWG